jgi:putative sterol carrier protein
MDQPLAQQAQSFFEKAVTLETAQAHLGNKDLTVLFTVLNGHPFRLRIQDGKIRCEEPADAEADLRLEADEDTYRALFGGRLSPAHAFHRRILRFVGIPYIGFPWLTRLMKLIQGGG